MKLKKIPKKKKIKFLLLLLLIYLVFSYTFYYSFKNVSNTSNEEFIKFIFNNNGTYYKKDKLPIMVNKTINYLLKIDFTKPYTLFNENIIGYNPNNDDDYSEIESLKKVSYYMKDPFETKVTNPIVYIYNSHQLENYNSDNLQIYGITPNVLMASYLLKEKLNEIGIPTIVEDNNLTEFLNINGWNHGDSYKASRIFILDKLNTYPSIKYIIDIHRDSVSKNLTYVKINNKDYARILFVVGLEHPGYPENLNTANNINTLFNTYYPGLSRGILKKEGLNVNGIYNQDISKNAMLIEIGGIDSNITEVVNTINAISDILGKYIGDNRE